MQSVSCSVRRLLIEPVWNWNLLCPLVVGGLCSLLIEPVWNWNLNLSNRSLYSWKSFNRTSMELKPLSSVSFASKDCPFNRTSMELKHGSMYEYTEQSCAFNRTSMELKQLWADDWCRLSKPFNRTSMESKYGKRRAMNCPTTNLPLLSNLTLRLSLRWTLIAVNH